MNNLFVKQFDQNIKFNYSCFDRVVLRGYIIRLFFAGGIAVLLRALGFNSLSNGVMRILTDQLNSHIEKIAKAQNIPIHWWPSVNGGPDGAKQPCYLKISSYLPFQCEFYFNGHNAIALQLNQKKIHCKLHGNAIVDIDDPEAIAEAVKSFTVSSGKNRDTSAGWWQITRIFFQWLGFMQILSV